MVLQLPKIVYSLLIPILFLQTIKASSLTFNFNANKLYTDSSDYDIKFYFLNLCVSDTSTYLNGFCQIQAVVQQANLSTFVVELSNKLTVDSVLFNGKISQFVHLGSVLKVYAAQAVSNNQLFNCIIYYRGLAISTNPMGGITSKFNVMYNTHVTSTLSEPYSASDWFPCKQVVADKADSAYLFFTAPKGVKVGSNGLLNQVVKVSDSMCQYRYITRYPIAYYLISYTAAKYTEYSYKIPLLSGDSVWFVNYIYSTNNYLQANKEKIDKTAEILSFYEEKLGDYPFKNEKYGHCVAQIDGGMEHQTMTTLVNFELVYVAHELAHQWLGNMVTCSDWQNIWINEGFASYFEYLAVEKFMGKDIANVWLVDAIDETLREPTGSLFIPENNLTDVRRIFNVQLTYKKGAVLIHTIRNIVNNDTLFFNIIKEYLKQYAHKNASANNFKNLLTFYTNFNWDTVFNQWFYGEGYPIYNVLYKQTADSVTINIVQKGSSAKTPLFNCNLQLLLHFDDFDTLVTINQNKPVESFKMFADNLLLSIDVNPNNTIPLQYTVNDNIENDVQLFKISKPKFNNELLISFTDWKTKKVRVVNSFGNVFYENENWGKTLKINSLNWEAGIYYVIVEQANNLNWLNAVKQ